MNNAHQRTRHRGRLFMLDYVSSIHNPLSTLLHQLDRTSDNFFVGSLPSATDQDRDVPGDLDYFMILCYVRTRIGFDNVGAKFDRLSNQRKNQLQIAINHVSTCFSVILHY